MAADFRPSGSAADELDALDPTGALRALGVAAALRGSAGDYDRWLAELGAEPVAPRAANAAVAPSRASTEVAAPAMTESAAVTEAGTEAAAGTEAVAGTPAAAAPDASPSSSGDVLAQLLSDEALDSDEGSQAVSALDSIVAPPAKIELGVDTDLNFDDLFDDMPAIGDMPLSGRPSAPSFMKAIDKKNDPLELDAEDLEILDALDIVIDD